MQLAALFGQSRAPPLPSTTTNGEPKTEVLQGKTNIQKVEFEDVEDEDCCPTCLEGNGLHLLLEPLILFTKQILLKIMPIIL